MVARLRSVALLLAAGAAVAGCGAGQRAASAQPKLPRELAAQLATLSDRVAAQLGSGDTCGALGTATQLDSQTADAIARGSIPGPLQQPLRTAADDLVRRIQCTPPPAEHGKGKHNGHKDHGGGGD